MKSLKKFSKRLFKNQAGQGMVEYILLLVIVIGLVMTFKSQISSAIGSKISDLVGDIGGITSQQDP
jgi:Flp pilus assembly pilin Flp